MPMNFSEVLNTKVQEIERPPLIPVGTYKVMVLKIPSIDSSNDGKWDFVSFPLRFLEAQDDVDQSELQAYGDLKNAFLSRRFMFNKEDDTAFKREEYNLRNFLENTLLVEMNGETSLKEALNNSVNRQFLAFVRTRPDKENKEIIYNEIGKTAPLV